MKKHIFIGSSIFFLFFLFGCSISETEKSDNNSIPPLEFPIDLSKGAQQINFEMVVSEERAWGIGMYFYLTKPPEWTIFSHRNETLENYHKISRILEVDNIVPAKSPGLPAKPSGIPANFKIKIVNRATNDILVENTVNRPITGATWRGRYCFLMKTRFPKGSYNVNIEYMPSSTRLSQLYAEMVVKNFSNGK